MQATQVQAVVWEDSTRQGATEPVYHISWACALEPTGSNYGARVPQLPKPTNPGACAPQQEAHAPQLEGPPLVATRESPSARTITQAQPEVDIF